MFDAISFKAPLLGATRSAVPLATLRTPAHMAACLSRHHCAHLSSSLSLVKVPHRLHLSVPQGFVMVLPRRKIGPLRAFRRADFDGFAKHVTSGEALRDAWRSANDGFEQLTYGSRKFAERVDRQFAVSRRLQSATRAVADRVRELDIELGIGRQWRTLYMDFSRNWPRYRRELKIFADTPLGRVFGTIFFLWLALSGWLFNILALATLVLPFAVPLVLGTMANSLVIQGNCPACKRQFMGYRNQLVRCPGCGNTVWQPKDVSKRRNGTRASPSESEIIDIEIDNK